MVRDIQSDRRELLILARPQAQPQIMPLACLEELLKKK
jgi:hypothetical protein